MKDENAKALLEEMDVDGWMFLTSCYNGAKLETSAVKSAEKVRVFLEEFHKHPKFLVAKEENKNGA